MGFVEVSFWQIFLFSAGQYGTPAECCKKKNSICFFNLDVNWWLAGRGGCRVVRHLARLKREPRLRTLDNVLCAMCNRHWTSGFILKNYGGELDSIGNAIWGGQETKLGLVFK